MNKRCENPAYTLLNYMGDHHLKIMDNLKGQKAVLDNFEPRAPTEPPREQVEVIPDVIEKRKKDTDGRLTIMKYAKGRLLGKVR